jgi:hypothetical protein
LATAIGVLALLTRGVLTTLLAAMSLTFLAAVLTAVLVRATACLESATTHLARRRSQLDRLYQSVIDDPDTLIQAVGLKAARLPRQTRTLFNITSTITV